MKYYHSNLNKSASLVNNNTNRLKIIEFISMIIYKHLLESLFIPAYIEKWGYMFDTIVYTPNFYKSVFSDGLLIVVCAVLANSKHLEKTYDFAFKLLMYMSLIPSLTLYSINRNISLSQLLCPYIFFFVLIIFLNILPNKQGSVNIIFPKIRDIDFAVILGSFAFSVIFWAFLGFPVTLNFDDTYDQRMLMRSRSLPSIVNYLYLMLGNAVIPYLFAKSLMNKRIVMSIISLITGVILFFSNGMKTWLILYFIGIGIFLCAVIFKNDYSKIVVSIEILFCVVIFLSWFLYIRFDQRELMGQLGRVIVIPSSIGYKYISFFSDPNNEFLYLRESVLKSFFQTPYPGGSDFFINYGANATLTSSRANNGLWGDAYRNFAMFGILIYPIMFIYVLKIIINSMAKQKPNVQLFIILLLVWSSINSSFFTWLLTGGIILLTIILKTENNKEIKDLKL